ncbi:hypothetical protein M5K25_007138 [Dendrobium thyrsiflorum]|uniref:Glutaredoxin domain-containing protein n=1 Tax=Dendrobium thyrsiflorum TaxID=117978 RepID=A0ABD0VEG5_DENTH
MGSPCCCSPYIIAIGEPSQNPNPNFRIKARHEVIKTRRWGRKTPPLRKKSLDAADLEKKSWLHILSTFKAKSTLPAHHTYLARIPRFLLEKAYSATEPAPFSSSPAFPSPLPRNTPRPRSSCRRQQQTLMEGFDDPFPPAAAAKKPFLHPRSLTYHHTFHRRAREVSRPFWRNLADDNPKPSIADSGVVVYTTSLRGIRRTHEDCCAVRSILGGFHVAVDERDVSMDAAYRAELQGLIGGKGRPVSLPQVFLRGRHIGGAEELRQLHEAGEMERLLEGVPLQDPSFVCGGCGGVRFVPCGNCSGSRKVFVEDEGRLRRCEECNENGLLDREAHTKSLPPIWCARGPQILFHPPGEGRGPGILFHPPDEGRESEILFHPLGEGKEPVILFHPHGKDREPDITFTFPHVVE